MTEQGGGASKTTDVAAGTSTGTDVDLQQFIEQAIGHIEEILKLEVARLDQSIKDLSELQKERRATDLEAVNLAKKTADLSIEVAKTTADAASKQHNDLIKQMRDQAAEAQRQLDKLTETYATKQEVAALERLLNARLKGMDDKLQEIDGKLQEGTTTKKAARQTLSDLRGVAIFAVILITLAITLSTYYAQR